MAADYKGAILVYRGTEMTKWFKTWSDAKANTGRIEIKFKDKDGEKQTLVKEYVGNKDKILIAMFCDAIVKYWPKFDPQAHHFIISAGHFHEVSKRKK